MVMKIAVSNFVRSVGGDSINRTLAYLSHQTILLPHHSTSKKYLKDDFLEQRGSPVDHPFSSLTGIYAEEGLSLMRLCTRILVMREDVSQERDFARIVLYGWWFCW